jgi:hypothetical protein
VERGPFVFNAETQQCALKALGTKGALCPTKPNEVATPPHPLSTV